MIVKYYNYDIINAMKKIFIDSIQKDFLKLTNKKLSKKQVEKKIGLGLLTCLLISLPVIHNWVFGNEIRLFALNRGVLIHWDRSLDEVWFQVVSVVWWKLKTYFGYWSSADSVRTFLALMFAPLARQCP